MKMSPMLIAIFLMSYNVVTADEALINYTCSKTPYPNVCLKALKSDPKSFDANVNNLGGIIVNQFISKTKQSLKIVNDKSKSTKDPKVKQALSQCSYLYDLVINQFGPAAHDAFVFGNPKFAVDYSGASKDEAEDCEKGFPRGTSPVSQLNTEIEQLAAVAVAIARSLL